MIKNANVFIKTRTKIKFNEKEHLYLQSYSRYHKLQNIVDKYAVTEYKEELIKYLRE